jgi:hypothetical protein
MMPPTRDPHRRPATTEPGRPAQLAAPPGPTEAAYARAFGVVAYTMNRFIIDQQLRAARHFDGDFEALILFGVLAHLNVAALLPPGTRPSRVLGRDGRMPDAQPRLRPVRLRDLAQITGIPRETIRRKLEQQRAQGRVIRAAGGWTLDVASVDAGMRDLTMDGARRFVEAADAVRAALRDAERALAEERATADRMPAPPTR